MFKELFTESTEKQTYKAFVGTHESGKGISMVDYESGEVADFKNIKELISKVQKSPRDYSSFFRKTSKDIRQEATKEGADSVEAVMVKIEVYPSWWESLYK